MPLADCRLVELKSITDPRGNLGVAEVGREVPFAIQRIYYIYGIPPDAERGAHGHRALRQLFIALHGGFDVLLDDGLERRCFRLDRPDIGLYVAPMMWRELRTFTGDAVCLVLASERYDEADYFRNYDSFLAAVPRV